MSRFRRFSLRLTGIAAAGVLVLSLSACGADEQSGESPSADGGSAGVGQDAEQALAQVTVTPGEGGAAPTVQLPNTPFSVEGSAMRVIEEGNGAEIGEQDTVTANYLLVNGRDGKPRASMWEENQASLTLGEIPQFASLVGTKVGTTVLMAIPASEAFNNQGDDKLDIAVDDTLIYVLQPIETKAPLTQASGKPVAPAEGLPSVQMGATPADPATITVPKTDPPTETKVQPLIVGEGPTVTPGQTIRVTYTGVTWRDPANPFDYSGRSPEGYTEFQVGTGQLIKAWDEHLVGQTVGSRILLVVAPKDGYGSAGQGEQIRGDDTLVFVVDILAAR